MRILPLRDDLKKYLSTHRLVKKWEKASVMFEDDIRHPSLHSELMQPRWRGMYSFRIDRKYRALFFITETGDAEIFQITNHYQK